MSIRTPLFEVPGVIGGPATAGIATVLICLENWARPIAPTRDLQRGRALPYDVGRALDHSGELGQHVQGLPVGLALEHTTAVAGLAASPPGPVEVAVGVGLDQHTLRVGLDFKGPCLATVELPPAAWDGSGPHGVGTVVGDVKPSCFSES
ncbi:hypothetical protein NL676_010201 [Syzygium grande]|nr:hypothetical protein NL676_010201 [Syzygium grande]